MINNDTMYGLYKEALSDKGRAILDSCTISKAEESIMLELLADIKTFHPEHNEAKSIIDLSPEDIEALRIGKQQRLFVNSYINTMKIIKDNQKRAKATEVLPVNGTQFAFVLKTFNTLLWQAMIEKAYVFKHVLIGRLYVECREDDKCKPKMDWKKSKDNRKAIIAKGGIPRIELEARTAAYKGEPYEGEEWVERHAPFNLTIKWRRTPYASLKLPAVKDFTMRLVKPSNYPGVIKALKDGRDNNKLEDLLIKYHRPND